MTNLFKMFTIRRQLMTIGTLINNYNLQVYLFTNQLTEIETYGSVNLNHQTNIVYLHVNIVINLVIKSEYFRENFYFLLTYMLQTIE